jgi:rhodanese-related sulfurtransferase
LLSIIDIMGGRKMRNRYFKNSLALFTAALMFAGIFGSAVGAGGNENKQVINVEPKNTKVVWGNYTVWDVWNLSNDHSSIQLLVDVRTNEEWNASWLDTPYPEEPIHYPLTLLQTTTGLQDFINLYNGKDIIFTCKGGGRSKQACVILGNSNFTGILNNMLGGITAWIAAGLPVRQNADPNAPVINGPTSVKAKKVINFKFYATDPNNDGVKLFIDWDDNTTKLTEYGYSGQQVTLSHKWTKMGSCIVKAKAIDFYGKESNWTILELTVPRTISVKILLHEFLDRLLERFPQLERVLNI